MEPQTMTNPTSPDRNNSFGFVRFAAACGVIISHHFPISDREEPRLFGFSLGGLAVYIFFITSGYLICKSIQSNPDPFRFVSARLLRIVPNLLFALLLTSVVTLLYYGNAAHWQDHLRYVAQNLVMLVRGGPAYDVAGVFEDRPMHALNGSLWSLPYEVWCYFILFALLKVAGASGRLAVAAALVVCIIAYWLPDLRLFPSSIYTKHLFSLGGWFFAGATLAAFGMKLPVFASPRMAWFARGGDPSYGMYIFAWPVQQFCAAWISNFALSLVVAVAVTTLIGYATWHGFERVAMLRVNSLATGLRLRLARK